MSNAEHSPAARPSVVFYWDGNADGTIGGTHIAMFDLITHMDRGGFYPIAGFAQDNVIAQRFRESGIETFIYARRPAMNLHRTLGRSVVARLLLPLLLPLQKLFNFTTRFIVPTLHHAIYLRRRGIDLIDLNNSITGNHEWMLASILARVPCITHEAGLRSYFSPAAHFFHKRMRAIICCSQAAANNLRKHGLNHELLTVAHPCVSLSRLQVQEPAESVRARFGLTGHGPVIGVVGNIREWKGQETVVRATALLARRWTDLRCLLVGKVGAGDEPYYERLQTIARELGIADRVVFTGYHPNPADCLNVMDVVIHASIYPEPFGMVNLEAMGLGKPVVSTNIGGPVEVFEEGISGFLVEPGIPQRLADAVAALLEDPALIKRVGDAAARRRATHFRLEDTVEKTQAVYRRVLNLEGRGKVDVPAPASLV